MDQYVGDQVKAIFFDHDDTLFGTIEAKWAQHRHVAKTFYGKDLTDAELREHWGKPLEQLARILYDTQDAEAAMANIKATHEAYPKILFAATIPLLKYLHGAGKVIGVVTATARYSFDYDLASNGVPREVIDYTQTAEDTPFHKPDPRVFEPAIAWLADRGIKPDEVLYVGDGLHDQKAATAAGFNFLGVQTGLVTAEEFTAAEIMSIQSIADLLPLGVDS